MIEAIICDWNRTLCEDKYEELFFKGLTREVVMQAVKKFNILKLAKLLKVWNKEKKNLRPDIDEAEDNSSYIRQIMGILNKNIINGMGRQFLEKYTGKYARAAAERLDMRLLEPLMAIRQKSKVVLGIISSGYKEGIGLSLANRGYRFDFIVANDFTGSSEKIIAFDLSVFNNKREILERVLREKFIAPGNTVYIGDDWQDSGCFAAVGYPVASFFASERYKILARQEWNAFVPENKEELEKYLFSISNEG